jgi:hypothetical protein
MWLPSGNGKVPCLNPEKKDADYLEIYFAALQNFAFGIRYWAYYSA